MDPLHTLDNDTFQRLRERVYTEAGLYISDTRRDDIVKAVSMRMEHLQKKGWSDYFDILFSEPDQTLEIKELLKVFAETSVKFFRDPDQFETFEKQVLPELIVRRTRDGERSLRIWSSAAGWGEEPYTIAMIVKKVLGAYFSKWNVEILATDIDQDKLYKIELAKYPESSIIDVPAEYKQTFFNLEGEEVSPIEDIQKMVTCSVVDLADHEAVVKLGKMDAIFCRNVLSFFDIKQKRTIVSCLNESLVPGGYLFVGQFESLHGIARAYKLIHLLRAMAYRKQLETATVE